MDSPRTVKIYSSYDDENRAERERRARMTAAERCREMATLQVRRWGESWTSTPIVKIASWERTSW